MRWSLAVVWVLTACAPRWRLALDRSGDAQRAPTVVSAAVERAKRAVRPVPYRSDVVRDAGQTVLEPLERRPGITYLAVPSYPEVTVGPLRSRCFLYDQALALLWLSWSGEKELADGLANTLRLLQRPDGAWGFSFDAETEFYNQGYVRTGAVAWTAWAMAFHGAQAGDPEALESARRAREWLWEARFQAGDRRDGLLSAGMGVWSLDGRHFQPDARPDHAVTEHQLDAWMALTPEPSRANALAARIVAELWMDDEGRFMVAGGAQGDNAARALDASGAWGALFLDASSHRKKAGRSLRFTESSFGTRAGRLDGFRPYLDQVDHPATAEREDLIFVEGSVALGLAGWRLGRPELANGGVELAATMSCLSRGGVPYANRRVADLTDEPSAAASLWFLFLEREMRTQERAPVFISMEAS